MNRADDFRPIFGIRSPHLQTVLGVLFKGSAFPHRSTRHLVPFADGDRFVLHESTPRTWRPGQPVALLVHGLGGSHRSGAIVRLARMIFAKGVRVFRIDMRGTGDGLRLARGNYNAGCSADIRVALEFLAELIPASPLWLVGISLGANVCLKLAGEEPEHPFPRLARVATIAPPIDLEACSALLAQPRNRFYELRFLKELIAESHRRAECHGESPPHFPPKMTLRRFDDVYTAPRAGYRDAADYYAHASSAPLIPRIRVPTLILAAKDDPFVDAGPIERLKAPPHVEIRVTAHGGHVGYIGWDGQGGYCWGERAVVHWLTSADSLYRRANVT